MSLRDGNKQNVFLFAKATTIKAQSAKSVCFCVSKNRQLVYIAAPYAFVQPPKTSRPCAAASSLREAQRRSNLLFVAARVHMLSGVVAYVYHLSSFALCAKLAAVRQIKLIL